MQKHRAIFSVDTNFFSPLDGVYSIDKYVLTPCEFTEKNQNSGCSNFVIQFNFNGKEENHNDKEGIIYWQNRKKAIDEAKIFIAWLVCASRHWARLSSMSTGNSMHFGPCIISPINSFDENVLDRVFHIDKKSENGTFEKILRPNLGSEIKIVKEFNRNFKLPSDFPNLTTKLFALDGNTKEKFLNACFSYQFALDMSMHYPTISILALVSAIESMMADEFTSQYCEAAKKRCPLKFDVMKKFRTFFERNLSNPLPQNLRIFLNDTYSKRRSTYVHRALLGEGKLRGPQFGISFVEDEMKFNDEKRYLERLVNAALIEWLRKI